MVFRVVVVAKGFAPEVLGKVDPQKGPFAVCLKARAGTSVPPDQVLLGRVLGPGKTPVANALVSVEQTALSSDYTVGSSPAGTDLVAVTDEAGAFELRCPQKFESMDLQVEAEGLARRYFAELRPGYHRQELALSLGASLSGRVVWRGKPAPGITIGAAQTNHAFQQWMGAFTTATKADGRFAFYHLPADRGYAVYVAMESVKGLGAVPTRIVQLQGDGSTNDMGTVEIVSGWRLAGQVRLSNSNGIPAHTQLFVDRQAGYMDGLSLELPPDGRFDLAHLPGETLVLNFGLSGYRPSGLNASIDPRSPSQLIGRLQSDYTNLMILLEPGQYRWDEFANRPEGEPPDKLPLGGIENPRNRLVLSGRVLDADTGAPLPQCQITLGRKPNPRYPAVLWDRTPRFCTNGAFAFELIRLHGTVRLKIEAEGYQPMLSEPLPASSSNYVFELKRGGR